MFARLASKSLALSCSIALLGMSGAAVGADTPHPMQVQAPTRAMVLVNQVGYEPADTKIALIQGLRGQRFTSFTVVDYYTGATVAKGVPVKVGPVKGWHDWVYWKADISSVKTPGKYLVYADGSTTARSLPFKVAEDVLKRYTLSNVLYFFKGQRVTGANERADSHLANPVPGGAPYVDLRGGWYAATGDYGVHMSEGSARSTLVYQEVPMADWVMIQTWKHLRSPHDVNFNQYLLRLMDGITYGADFLVRAHIKEGSFYRGISAGFDGGKPGIDKLKLAKDRSVSVGEFAAPKDAAKKAGQRQAGSYEVSFRTGGGLAVAALAAASKLPHGGEFSRQRYLQVAKEAYAFLEQHNAELEYGTQENIVDYYCALLAATELYKATQEDQYLQAANAWATKLMGQQVDDTGAFGGGYWRAGTGKLPFVNETDEGLPVVALVQYFSIAPAAQQAKVKRTIQKSLQFSLRAAHNVTNPFGYARQLVKPGNGKMRIQFFFPHNVSGADDVNGTGRAFWWQGENARLASMAAAARAAIPLFPNMKDFQHALRAYADSQLDWILGRNPYNTSMLMGNGANNATYGYLGTWQYTSAPGGVINGITGGMNPEGTGIAFNLRYQQTGEDDDWRWTEQWVPHDLWYLYAVGFRDVTD